jgi:hypothetical protein
MTAKHLKAAILSAMMLAVVPMQSAVAAEVYTWVDAEGVTHFSQLPPRDESVQAQTIELAPTPASAEPSPAASIIELANQLEAARLAREQAALDRQIAMEQLSLEEKRIDTLAAQPAAPTYYYPVGVGHKARPHRYHRKWPARQQRNCTPTCDRTNLPHNPPFHRTGQHGTTHLKPYKSLFP